MGFFDCPTINPIAKINPKIAQIQPINRLDKIRHFYKYFQDLGINTIYFGPIFESCTHGYDIINYFQIDRRLGTNQLLHEIVTELHSLNIKVILDGVFNHTSRLFPAFVNLRQQKKKSKFIDWYQQIDFSNNTIWNDGFCYQPFENHTELPQLNLTNTDVQKFLLKIIQFWQNEFQIDGWRLDVAYNLPIDFIAKIKSTTINIKPNSFIFGELIHENYADYVNYELLDSCTNYQLYRKIYESINQQDPWQLEEELNRQQKIYPNLNLINFTGNHDTSRLFSLLHDKSKTSHIFELLMTIPGIPCIYYGDEINLDGEKFSRFDDQVRQTMPYPRNFSSAQKEQFQKIKYIIQKYKK